MSIGKAGEDVAVHYLKGKDYRIVKRNHRSKLGEIDIIAVTGRTLVFCEVKTRMNKAFGEPFEAVTAAKQRTIRNVAELYLATARSLAGLESIRFDVISLLAQGEGFQITHIEDAF